MKVAVVAHNFSLGPSGGNVFIAKRMAELAKTDEVYGIRVDRRDLSGWKFKRYLVAVLGKSRGSKASALLFRMTHPVSARPRFLSVEGSRTAIPVYRYRHVDDSAESRVGEGSMARIAKDLRRRGCDILHSHFLWYADIGAMIASRLGVPQVITAHGSDVHETMRGDEAKRALFVSLLEKADAAIFVSRALLDEAVSYGYSGARAIVAYNGYDPAIFFPPPESEDRRDGTRLLFVGHLLEVKGADRLPRIFSLIAARLPGARLDIVGGDAGELWGESIRAEFARSPLSGSVSFHGQLLPAEIAELMRGADLLIVPSRSEGFGCVAIEAQACGTPALGTATGGLPEAIGVPGMTVAQEGDFEAAFAEKAIAVLVSRSRPLRPDIASFAWGSLVAAERGLYEAAIRSSNDR